MKKNLIFFWPSSKFFIIPRSLKTTRKNHSSPNNGLIKNFFVKSNYFDINNKEITQISKSKPKKISILCTFKESGGEVYWENPPVPHLVKAFKVTAASCTVIGNLAPNFQLCSKTHTTPTAPLMLQGLANAHLQL